MTFRLDVFFFFDFCDQINGSDRGAAEGDGEEGSAGRAGDGAVVPVSRFVFKS